MAHVAKHTRAASGHLFKHYERAKDENGEYLKFGNQDIDPERSHLNYNLGPARSISQGDFVRQRCQDVYCFQRKDVNVMCNWIVTLPAEMKGAGNEKEFFEKTYDFLADRYGRDNVVSAYVHMDEISPHMHFAFVPVVPDKKRGLKVSAKERLSKLELKAFHGDLDKHLVQTMADRYPGGILNGATIEGNRSIEELKRKSAADRLRAADEQTKEIVTQAEETKQLLEKDIAALQKQMGSHKAAFQTMNDIESIGTPLPGFGKTKKVSMTEQEARDLKDQASAYWITRSERNKARQEAASWKRWAEKYKKDLPHLEDENQKLQLANMGLEQERDQALQTLEDVKDVIRSDPQLKAAYTAQLRVIEAAEEQQRRQQQRGHDFSR